MKAVTINARYKNRQLTGVERFAYEVERELRSRMELAVSEVNPGRELAGLKGHSWEQFVLPTKIEQSEILFSPCNTGPLKVANQFLVIHDAAVWDYPGGFSSSFGTLYRFLLPRLAQSCRWVATVSEFSRERLSEHLKLDKEKILVLGNAASPDFQPGTKKDNGRFFCVSSLNPRKNFQTLIKAWKDLRDRGALPEGATLRIAGGANPRNFSAFEFEDCPSVNWLGRISDQQLIEEYQSAVAFVFPSFYEGFGLPPLEALACGCPVLLSDRASLPEVGGLPFNPTDDQTKGAVIYFDPGETDSIASAINTLLNLSPEKLRKLSDNAINRSQQFSWRSVADRIFHSIENG